MDDLLDDFVAETRDTLEAIAGALVAWEADPADQARLDGIFRFVHTVKGSCGFLDLPRLERLSHACEDALAEVRSGARTADSVLVDAVLGIVDRIGELTDLLERDRRLPDGDDDALIEALRQHEAKPAEAVALAGPQPRAVVARSIRLPVELLDRMMAGVSDMVLARNELSRELRGADVNGGAALAFERLSHCLADVREAVTRTRMARVDTLFAALPRLVRDLAAQLGRQVRLEIDGGEVELDREMIEMIRDPLTHIVRNALDHGIEPPATRIAAGKTATGLLRIAARQSGNHIIIDAIDDGRGIDGDALVRKAIAAGVLDEAAAATLPPGRRLELIFAPGLSTAAKVTAISGRGVGMDLVRANIERIGGTVDIDSRPGHGVRLSLRVPLTLTIIPALIVGAGEHRFAIPRSAIDEIVRVDGAGVTVERMGDGHLAAIRGRTMPMIDLGILLGCATATDPEQRAMLVVLRAGLGERFALRINRLFDHEELVVKPAAPAIMACGLYAGTTLPDNSRPILLIDVAGLAGASGIDAEQATAPPALPAEEQTPPTPTLLFRDLDGTERAVALGLVERIEDVAAADIRVAGERLTLARGDTILPLFARARLPEGQVRVVRLGDGVAHVAYAIGAIIDVVDLVHELIPDTSHGPVAGLLLVDGRQVELIDPYPLFAQAPPAPAQRPLCRVPDDPWSRHILAPLLSTVGYRVVHDLDGREADVVIRVDGQGCARGGSARTVLLRSAPEPVDATDASIWRYDRPALLAALGTVGNGG